MLRRTWLLISLIAPACLLLWVSYNSQSLATLLQDTLKSYHHDKPVILKRGCIVQINDATHALIKWLWIVKGATGKGVLNSRRVNTFNSSLLYSSYYRVKYYTGVKSGGSIKNAVKRTTQANPFFNKHYALLVDMSQPSKADRMMVYDIQRQQVVFSTRVMHGKGSGTHWATKFSNRLGSHKSSLGRYVIVQSYNGKFGEAYRLAGLDETNSNALVRSIVLHHSAYVRHDRIGRSDGCPAVSSQALALMKPYLQVGTILWIYR
jgi:hypothetical protein